MKALNVVLVLVVFVAAVWSSGCTYVKTYPLVQLPASTAESYVDIQVNSFTCPGGVVYLSPSPYEVELALDSANGVINVYVDDVDGKKKKSVIEPPTGIRKGHFPLCYRVFLPLRIQYIRCPARRGRRD